MYDFGLDRTFALPDQVNAIGKLKTSTATNVSEGWPLCTSLVHAPDLGNSKLGILGGPDNLPSVLTLCCL